MTVYDVVRKLVGPIEPTGDHNVDQERLSNLIAMGDLIVELMQDIDKTTTSYHRQEASMSKIGREAKHILTDIANFCEDYRTP